MVPEVSLVRPEVKFMAPEMTQICKKNCDFLFLFGNFCLSKTILSLNWVKIQTSSDVMHTTRVCSVFMQISTALRSANYSGPDKLTVLLIFKFDLEN